MSAVLDDKARRISVLMQALREATEPDRGELEHIAYIRGVRAIGCPLIDALDTAYACLHNLGRVDASVERAAVLNALDTLLAELEAKLVHLQPDPHDPED